MDVPTLLVIDELPSGTFLLRYTLDGRVVGDTWHESIEAAKTQAAFEYVNGISVWREVPIAVSDAVSFGLANID